MSKVFETAVIFQDKHQVMIIFTLMNQYPIDNQQIQDSNGLLFEYSRLGKRHDKK